MLVSVVRMNYVLSASVSFITATALNCLLSMQHVFLPGRFSRRLEFTVFLLVTGVGLGLNQLTISTLVVSRASITSSQSVLGCRL